MNIEDWRIIHEELTKDYCSSTFLADELGLSKPYMWSVMRLLKATQFLNEKYDIEKPKLKLYMLKPKYNDFNYFYTQLMTVIS